LGCYFSHRHLWQSLVASEAEAYGSMRLTEIDSYVVWTNRLRY
jgi:hypothetical protein